MRRGGLLGACLCAGCFNPGDGGGGATIDATAEAEGTSASTTSTTRAPTGGTSTTRPTTGEAETAECPGGCSSTTSDTETTTAEPPDGVFELAPAAVVQVAGPWALAAAHSLPDEHQDLYVSSFTTESVYTIDGSTRTPVGTPVLGISRSLAAGEFDGLAGEDVVVAVQSVVPLLMLMSATGTAQQPLIMADSELLMNCEDASSVVVADINSDLKLDAVVACAATSAVYVVAGGVDDTLEPPIVQMLELSPVGLALAQVGGSPAVDLIAIGSDSLKVYPGSGILNPAFAVTAMPSFPGLLAPRGVTVGAYDGDGFPDVLVTQYPPNQCSVAFGSARGPGTPVEYTCGVDIRDALLTDVTADGIVDLVTISGPDQGATLAVARGNGDGTFESVYAGSTGMNPVEVEAVDFSGDGHPDLAVAAFGEDAVYLYVVDP